MIRVTCIGNVMLQTGGIALAGSEIDLPPHVAEKLEREGVVRRIVARSAPQPVESEPAVAHAPPSSDPPESVPVADAQPPVAEPAPEPEPIVAPRHSRHQRHKR